MSALLQAVTKLGEYLRGRRHDSHVTLAHTVSLLDPEHVHEVAEDRAEHQIS